VTNTEHLDTKSSRGIRRLRDPRPLWPPQPLIDLAAGRDPEHFELTEDLLAIAADHRMTGLLWSWARTNAPDTELKSQLAVRDLQTQAHLLRVWTLLESTVLRLRAADIDVASIKGPITESRWFERAGERPCSDVDLWLSPYQLDRAGDALRLLQPDHPWCQFFGELALAGEVQTVTLKVDGIEIDLHLDLLKTGLPMLHSKEVWDSTQRFELPGGTEVRVLDPASALFHLLVHLNKDRFQRLLGYADIARIADQEVDWSRLGQLAKIEGLQVSVALSLETVDADLMRPQNAEATRTSGIRASMWRTIWRRNIRLLGSAGRTRLRHRQLWIALMARRPLGDRAKALNCELFPPRAVLDAATEHHRPTGPQWIRRILRRN